MTIEETIELEEAREAYIRRALPNINDDEIDRVLDAVRLADRAGMSPAKWEECGQQAIKDFNEWLACLNSPYRSEMERRARSAGSNDFVMPRESTGEGSQDDRTVRLLGTLTTLGGPHWFHVDAIRCTSTPDGLELVTCGEDEEGMADHLAQLQSVDPGGAMNTMEFGPWSYLVVIYPYSD